jgi:hypothetical protein
MQQKTGLAVLGAFGNRAAGRMGPATSSKGVSSSAPNENSLDRQRHGGYFLWEKPAVMRVAQLLT